MQLRDYVQSLRKQWLLIVLCLFLAVGAGTAATAQTPPQYRSSVTFFVSTQSEDASAAYTGGLFSQQRVRSYADIVAGSAVANAVVAATPELELGDVEGRISARAVPDTVLLETTVTAGSAEQAFVIAQSVAATLPGLVDELERQDGGRSPIKMSVVEEPELPAAPFSPRPARNIAMAIALGLLVGVGIAVLRETLDNTVKDSDDVRAVTGTATLGVLVHESAAVKRPILLHDSSQSARAEALRHLRTNLQFVDVDHRLRSLVVTSAVTREGKSTLACNLAITISRAGRRVCLVEGDLRRPRISEYLNLAANIGVTDVLIGAAQVDDALQPWGDGALTVLASGPLPPNPSELLSSQGMLDLLATLHERFDFVVVDAPALLPVTDAAVLATMTGGALLVVHAGRTRDDQLRHAADKLRAVDANVLGTVLNMVSKRASESLYRYNYDNDTSKPRLSSPEDTEVMWTSARGHARTGASVTRHPTP